MEADIYTEFGLERFEDEDILSLEEIGFMQGYIEAECWLHFSFFFLFNFEFSPLLYSLYKFYKQNLFKASGSTPLLCR